MYFHFNGFAIDSQTWEFIPNPLQWHWGFSRVWNRCNRGLLLVLMVDKHFVNQGNARGGITLIIKGTNNKGVVYMIKSAGCWLK